MKITLEERALLDAFAGAVAGHLGLPGLPGIKAMMYIVDRFTRDFNNEAESWRAQIAEEVEKVKAVRRG